MRTVRIGSIIAGTAWRPASLLGVLALAACASPTPYQPATDGVGYADRVLETDRFRVTFGGNAETPRATVEDYLLYRAAELALAQGRDYFVLADRDTEARTRVYGGWPYGYAGFARGWYGTPTAPLA